LRAALHGIGEARDFKEHLLAIPAGEEDDLFERRRATRRRQRSL
jgi:hypothetical protein